MEGVPFVGNDACAHNLLLKGRPLIMRLRHLPRLLTEATRRQTLKSKDYADERPRDSSEKQPIQRAERDRSPDEL